MSRQLSLSLFRRILREARLMPTANRRVFVRERARAAWRDAQHENDPEKLAFHLQLGETQLENVTVQRLLLTKLAEEGNLKGPKS